MLEKEVFGFLRLTRRRLYVIQFIAIDRLDR